eukprot:5045490-Pyramimonas_sp.AAC.1
MISPTPRHVPQGRGRVDPNPWDAQLPAPMEHHSHSHEDGIVAHNLRMSFVPQSGEAKRTREVSARHGCQGHDGAKGYG